MASPPSSTRATTTAPTHLAQYLNMIAGLVAAIGILRGRRPMGGQWPMIIGGGLSVLAGISFIVGAILLIRAARRADHRTA